MIKSSLLGLVVLCGLPGIAHAAVSEQTLHVEKQSTEEDQPRKIRWFMDNINGETLRCRGTVLREFIFVLFDDGQWKSHVNIYDDSRHRRYQLWIWVFFDYSTTGKPVPGGSVGIKTTTIVPGEPQVFGPHGSWEFGKEVYNLLTETDVEAHVYVRCDRL